MKNYVFFRGLVGVRPKLKTLFFSFFLTFPYLLYFLSTGDILSHVSTLADVLGKHTIKMIFAIREMFNRDVIISIVSFKL